MGDAPTIPQWTDASSNGDDAAADPDDIDGAPPSDADVSPPGPDAPDAEDDGAEDASDADPTTPNLHAVAGLAPAADDCFASVARASARPAANPVQSRTAVCDQASAHAPERPLAGPSRNAKDA